MSTESTDPSAGSAAAISPLPEAPEPTPPRAVRRRTFDPDGIVRWLTEAESSSVLVALGAVCVVFAIAHPSFFAISEIQNVLQQAVPYALLAMGAAFLIMMGQLDLSVGSIVGLTIVLCALLISHGMSVWLAVLVGIGASIGMGLVNVFLVQVIGIPALLATLAMWYAYGGLANGLADGNPITFANTSSSFFSTFGGNAAGLPVSVWVMFAIALLLTAVLRFTPFGYRVRSIGSNPEAAHFSGISIPRVKIQAFVLAGLLSGVAAVLYLAFSQDGDPQLGNDWALFAIAAAIIGGTPMRGGSGTVIGAMIGAILLAGVQAGLIYFNVPDQWTGFALGVVIVAAVTIDAAVRHGTRGRRLLE